MTPLVRLARYLALVLLLLMTQQLGLVHGYAHAAEALAHAQSDDPGDAPHESSATCLDCVALAGAGPTPTSGVALPADVPQGAVLAAGAVPPAPTFAHRTAFDSRAPPRLPS